jgi:hypothetical protein
MNDSTFTPGRHQFRQPLLLPRAWLRAQASVRRAAVACAFAPRPPARRVGANRPAWRQTSRPPRRRPACLCRLGGSSPGAPRRMSCCGRCGAARRGARCGAAQPYAAQARACRASALRGRPTQRAARARSCNQSEDPPRLWALDFDTDCATSAAAARSEQRVPLAALRPALTSAAAPR